MYLRHLDIKIYQDIFEGSWNPIGRSYCVCYWSLVTLNLSKTHTRNKVTHPLYLSWTTYKCFSCRAQYLSNLEKFAKYFFFSFLKILFLVMFFSWPFPVFIVFFCELLSFAATILLLLRSFSFPRNLFSFAASFFLLRILFSFGPWAFFFCRGNFLFAVTYFFFSRVYFLCHEHFSFAARLILLPGAFLCRDQFVCLPRAFFFCRGNFLFAVTYFLSFTSIFLTPRAFFFCRKDYSFAGNFFYAVTNLLVCREHFSFAGSFFLLPWHLWGTVEKGQLN